jgi:hypothetical protein
MLLGVYGHGAAPRKAWRHVEAQHMPTDATQHHTAPLSQQLRPTWPPLAPQVCPLSSWPPEQQGLKGASMHLPALKANCNQPLHPTAL